MRTERDLRAVLAAREELAPQPDDVLAGVPHAAAGHRRRVAGAVAVAAAAVAAAVVVAVPVVLLQDSGGTGVQVAQPAATTPPDVAGTGPAGPPESPVPVGSPEAFDFTIADQTVAGFEVVPTFVTYDYQEAEILLPGEELPSVWEYSDEEYPPLRRLTVYDPGANAGETYLRPGEHRERVRVNGTPGWYTTADGVSVLEWEYVPDGAAKIYSRGEPPLSQQTALALAEGITFVDPYPATLPYRLDYLPGDLEPVWVLQRSGRAGEAVSRTTLSGDGPPYGIEILASAGGQSWPSDWPAPTSTTIAGRPAQCVELSDGSRCAVDAGGFTVDIGFGALTPDELARLVDGMTFATWDDRDTWYEVDAALPDR
jgi:hypothetical protein